MKTEHVFRPEKKLILLSIRQIVLVVALDAALSSYSLSYPMIAMQNEPENLQSVNYRSLTLHNICDIQ